MRKKTKLILSLLLLITTLSVQSQIIVPGGIISDSTSLRAAFGNNFEVYYDHLMNRHELILTDDILLDTTITFTSGTYSLISQEKDCNIYPNKTLSTLFNIKSESNLWLNLTIQEKDSTNLIFNGNYKDSIFCTNSIIYTESQNLYISHQNRIENFSGDGSAIITLGNTSIGNAIIRNNHSIGNGGAISVINGTTSLRGSHISNNTAQNGGAIYLNSCKNLLISNAHIQNNTANLEGSGIYVDSAAILSLQDTIFIKDTIHLCHSTALQIPCQSLIHTHLNISADTLYPCLNIINLESCYEDIFSQQIPKIHLSNNTNNYELYTNPTTENITIYNPHTALYQDACDTFYWEDADLTLSKSGTYTFIKNSNNSSVCDSVFKLHLTMHTETDTLKYQFCHYDYPIILQEDSIFEAGTYHYTYTSSWGCDSTLILQIETIPVTHDTLPEIQLCINDFPYIIADSAIYTYGEHTILTNCGSTIFANITQTPEANIIIDTVICANELPFIFADSTITEAGTYHISTSNNCDTNFTIHLQINSNPTLTISGDSTICEGESTTIQVNEDFTNYSWSNESTTRHTTIKESGIYTVTVTDSLGCANSATFTLHTLEKPNAKILGSPISCENNYVILSADSTYQNRWSTEETSDSIYVTNSGKVILYATSDMGCTSTDTVNVLINTAEISDIQDICLGDGVEIRITEDLMAYEWSTGEHTPTIYVSPTETTTYTVTTTLTPTCTLTLSTIVRVHPYPQAKIFGDTIICENTPLLLSTYPADYYLWSTGDTTPTIHVTQTGLYQVVLTTQHGCSITAEHHISEILPAPLPQISGNDIICNNETVVLTATGGNHFEWSTGTHGNTTRVNSADTYSVTCTYDNGCQSIAHKTITDVTPQIIITGDTSICIGQSSIVQVSGGVSYHWNTGESTSILVSSPSSTTTRIVDVTSETGCQASRIVTIQVNSYPTPSILGPDIFCQGDSATLYASGGVDYNWSHGQTGDQINVKSTGIYVVTVTNAYGCSSTTSHSITAQPQPHAVINGNTSFCEGSSSQLIASGGTSYLWNTGANTPSIIVQTAGTYSVTATNNNGCTSSAEVIVNTFNAPTISISGNTRFCEGEYTILTAQGGTSYQWSDGSTDSTIMITQSGNYTVTATNEGGCTSVASKNITVLPTPNVTITGNTILCEGNSTTLIANGGSHYAWNNGTNTSFINVTETGSYTVSVTDNNGCTAIANTTVIVNEAPQITITGDTNICVGESTLLTASIFGNGQFVWSNGERLSFINVSPTSTTTYNVVATNSSGCASTARFTVNVRQYPTPTIIGNTNFCAGESTTLKAIGGDTYTWNNYETTAEININTPGSYVVTATNQYGCSSTASCTITMNPLPIGEITGESNFCEGSYTNLTAHGGNAYLWSSGEATPSIHAQTAGTYMVTITNTHGCSTIAQTEITAFTPPNVTIEGAHAICEGTYTVLNANSDSNCSYEWNTQSVGNSIATNNAGLYTVTATSANGCTATATHRISINPLPIPTIVGNLTPCLGDTTTLTVSGGSSYIWSTGSTDNNITIRPTAPITYSVTATSDAGCTASNSVAIIVNPIPTPVIQGDLTLCFGTSSTITAVGGIAFQWSTGETTPSITISEAGNYTVTATNSFGCTASISTNATVDAPMVANIIGTNVICAGDTTLLRATGGNNFIWNIGNSTESISVSPLTTTTYTCTVSNANNCEAIATHTINVTPLPTPEINGPNHLCEGTSIQLTAVGGTSYQWNNNINNNQITINSPGLYTVTVTQNNCQASTHTYITQYENPQGTIVGATQFCEGDSSQITALGGDNYLWNTGVANNSITVSENGIYTVTISNSHGCTTTSTTQIVVWDNPQVSITGTTQLCRGENTILTANGATSYLWNNGHQSPLLTITPTESGTYSVTGTNTHNCTATDTITVIVNPTYDINISDVICQGNNYNNHNFNLGVQNTAGTFTHTQALQSTTGCDSIITLSLVVNPKPILPESISGPSVIGTAGVYTYSVLNAQHTNSFEWSINNPNWELSAGNSNIATLNITTNSTATLSVIGINNCGISAPLTLEIHSTISIDEINTMEGIKIYPNPTTNYLYISNQNHNTHISHIEIYDIFGKIILRKDNLEDNTPIDFTSYSNGTYIIKLYNQKQVIGNAKIIKQ